MAALDYCKGQGRSLCVGITNVVGSEVSRETECGTHVKAGSSHAGGRGGVASTKAYTTQFLAMAMFGTLLGYDSKQKVERRQGRMDRVVKEQRGWVKFAPLHYGSQTRFPRKV